MNMSPTQNFFPAANAQAANQSSMNTKRKRTSWCVEDYDYAQNKQMRTRPPMFDRRHTYANGPPDLVPDSSATASDEDQGMDQDIDMDNDMDMGMDEGDGGAGGGGFEYENGAGEHAHIRDEGMDDGHDGRGQSMGYAFGSSGSGGFGFGPGAMEDDDDDCSEGSGKATYPCAIYPSLAPHTNPHHFSNLTNNNPNSLRPKSPLSAQPFSTTLRAPPRTPGLLQPTIAAPLGANATDVDRARAQHGPQCKSIPKLVMSPYPDVVTGKRSLWSQCGDCGAVELSSL